MPDSSSDEPQLDEARRALSDAQARAEADANLIATSRVVANYLRVNRRPDHIADRLRAIIRGEAA